jgi:hypothetical protein
LAQFQNNWIVFVSPMNRNTGGGGLSKPKTLYFCNKKYMYGRISSICWQKLKLETLQKGPNTMLTGLSKDDLPKLRRFIFLLYEK